MRAATNREALAFAEREVECLVAHANSGVVAYEGSPIQVALDRWKERVRELKRKVPSARRISALDYKRMLEARHAR